MANGKPSLLVRVLLIAIALIAGLGAGLIVVGLADGDGGAATEPAPAAEPEQTEPAQVFESDAATVEYRGSQDAAGNAVVTFAVTNKTDQPLSAFFENVVVNDQFNVEVLGGTEVPIDPGNTGAASMAFGVATQTTLSGFEELETASADLVLYSGSPTEPVATMSLSVAI